VNYRLVLEIWTALSLKSVAALFHPDALAQGFREVPAEVQRVVDDADGYARMAAAIEETPPERTGRTVPFLVPLLIRLARARAASPVDADQVDLEAVAAEFRICEVALTWGDDILAVNDLRAPSWVEALYNIRPPPKPAFVPRPRPGSSSDVAAPV
jgi:hypothetical protein